MTHMPGIPVKFDEPSEWVPAKRKCRQCGSASVMCRMHESSCGGYEDDEFKCSSCHHVWWVDGIDS